MLCIQRYDCGYSTIAAPLKYLHSESTESTVSTVSCVGNAGYLIYGACHFFSSRSYFPLHSKSNLIEQTLQCFCLKCSEAEVAQEVKAGRRKRGTGHK